MEGRSSPPLVRSATVADAAACAAIYGPYVTDTAISFETVPPSPEQMAERIATALRSRAWIVLEDEGRVVGYAYGSPFKSRPAYRWSCEVSVYLKLGRRRTGAGRALYGALFVRLVERGFRTVVGHDAAQRLERRVASDDGFEPVGTYHRIGWKYGEWHNVEWAQRPLVLSGDPPLELQ